MIDFLRQASWVWVKHSLLGFCDDCAWVIKNYKAQDFTSQFKLLKTLRMFLFKAFCIDPLLLLAKVHWYLRQNHSSELFTNWTVLEKCEFKETVLSSQIFLSVFCRSKGSVRSFMRSLSESEDSYVHKVRYLSCYLSQRDSLLCEHSQ